MPGRILTTPGRHTAQTRPLSCAEAIPPTWMHQSPGHRPPPFPDRPRTQTRRLERESPRSEAYAETRAVALVVRVACCRQSRGEWPPVRAVRNMQLLQKAPHRWILGEDELGFPD